MRGARPPNRAAAFSKACRTVTWTFHAGVAVDRMTRVYRVGP